MLTIYAPSNKQSKAWEVFNGVKLSWPEKATFLNNGVEKDPNVNAMFWGFVGNNLEMVKKLEARKHKYWFTDTPYFGRFDNNNLQPDNHYWRICKNAIHATFLKDCKADRFNKFNISIKAPTLKGDHILVCPSSAGINAYLDAPNWTRETVEKLKRVTDRPIKVREKPRGRGTSGPSEAKISLKEDLENAWACVTSCSISAVESVCMGKPVFCHEKSFARAMGNLHLEDIEQPFYGDPEPWLYSLAYQQFTPEELANGTAVEILMDKGIL
tara:strand:- start:8717 stop:9526 length:810 start_codon:yes stop_codon:yes gene_type:complete